MKYIEDFPDDIGRKDKDVAVAVLEKKAPPSPVRVDESANKDDRVDDRSQLFRARTSFTALSIAPLISCSGTSLRPARTGA